MSISRPTLAKLSAVCAPALLVGAMRVAFAPAPAAATTASADAPVAVVLASTKATPDQERVLNWIQSLPEVHAIKSPMDHPTPAPSAQPTLAMEPEPQPTFDPQPEPAEAPRINHLAGLQLTAVLGSRTSGLATINGVVYRVGDEVRPGCRLTAIDARNSVVEFSLPDGSIATLGREP